MRHRMPATGGPRHFDGAIDPVHGESDHPGRIRAEGEFRQLQEICDFRGEFEFLVVTQRVGDNGFAGIQPEFLVFDFRFQLTNHIPIGIQRGGVALAGLERFDIPIETGDHVHVVGNLFPFCLQILLAKEHVVDPGLVVHRRNGDPAGIPRTTPAAVVNAECEEGKARFTTDLLRQYLVERDAVDKCR